MMLNRSGKISMSCDPRRMAALTVVLASLRR